MAMIAIAKQDVKSARQIETHGKYKQHQLSTLLQSCLVEQHAAFFFATNFAMGETDFRTLDPGWCSDITGICPAADHQRCLPLNSELAGICLCLALG